MSLNQTQIFLAQLQNLSSLMDSFFLRMPPELRDQIYDIVFEDVKQERVVFSYTQRQDDKEIRKPLEDLPSICRSSQQLYLEATPRYLRRTTILSSSTAYTSWLLGWLATFPYNSGYRAVRQLAFRNFHGSEQSKGYELISLCDNLLFVDIMFGDEFSDPGHLPSLSLRAISTSFGVYETLDNIIFKYQLHRLVEMSKLKQVEFGFHDWDQLVSAERARQVKEWLNTSFCARSKRVEVTCRQMQWGAVRPDNYLFAMFGRWNASN